MQKFTIFTIIFSFAVILVMAELLINSYLQNKQPIGPVTKTAILNEAVFKEESPGNITKSKELADAQKWLTESDLFKSGLKDVTYKEIPFSGKLFQLLEMPGLKNDQVKKKNFFQNEDFILTTYEIHLDELNTAAELYSYIRDNIAQVSTNISINESNSFGDNSFYINNEAKKKTVFLVVLISNNVYAFEYPHRIHTYIKKLLANL